MSIKVTCPSCQGAFKAPDSAAGRQAKCPKCGGLITIPDPLAVEEVVEAEIEPGPAFDDADFDEEFEVEPPPEVTTDAQDRKPCPMCGEMIQRDAVKCRYCGEIFDPVLRSKQRKSVAPEDEDLSALEWVVAILCSGIGCILGIIYIVQGKPKGKKMLIVSLCVQGFWFLVQVILGMLGAGMQ